MVTTDSRFDAYIAKAPAFAQPILRELRARMHAACPDANEVVKWRSPSFECGGLLAGMAAFEAHCTFGFWKDKLLRKDAATAQVLDGMGRLTTVADLPPKRVFEALVKAAVQLNAAGAAVPRTKKAKAPIAPHPAFVRALAASKRAQAHFAAFSPSAQREYLEWIADAKQDATRERRIEQAVEWIGEGKRRNWKYENC